MVEEFESIFISTKNFSNTYDFKSTQTELRDDQIKGCGHFRYEKNISKLERDKTQP